MHARTFAPMEAEALQDCLTRIETELGWGPATAWSTADFTALGDRIAERTGVHLSATTLKRVWGRVTYRSSPSPTTLDALAQYNGYESWRAYVTATAEVPAEVPAAPEPAPPPPRSEKRTINWLGVAAAILAVVGLGFLLINLAPAAPPEEVPPLDPTDFTFHHRPVTTGLPNSVVFTYDARAAPTDSVYIQQSWDERRRTQVSREGSIHTSIYYLPGYYRASLRVGDQEVRSRELLIPSDGWTVAVAGDEVPVYLPYARDDQMGTLAVTADDITALGLSLQPTPPQLYFSNVGEFEDVRTDNFRFDTRLRQTYGEGAAACRETRVLLLLRNSALIVPLSSPGCVAELGVYAGGHSLEGSTNDLSSFGVQNGDWVDLSVRGEGELLAIYLNETLALQLESRDEVRDILGIRYVFAGGGAVDYLRLEGADGNVWEEDFGVGK